MQPLEPPAPRHEIAREPFEQLGMCWRFTPDAIVANRPHDSFAEMMLADPIHEHPCQHRTGPVLGID
jgi:hypothetical protein